MSDIYPLFVYEYGFDGLHGGRIPLNNAEELRDYFEENLKKILAEKREFRITNSLDLMCFHVRNGKVLYNGRSPVN